MNPKKQHMRSFGSTYKLLRGTYKVIRYEKSLPSENSDRHEL